jgi:hypothetical protein
MLKDQEKWVHMLQEQLERGRSVDEALGYMRQHGASMMQCYLSLREGRGMAYEEAKAAVIQSPAWRDMREPTLSLHDALIQALTNDEHKKT